MRWDTLISDKRLGLEHYHDPKPGARNDFQRDFDRLVFSSPFRRLQNKTQVFPLPGSIFVHNRLTHSLEVSCVGRSLAREVAIRLRSRYSDDSTILDSLSYIGDIVAAACLAHDLGNPPFGHSGEKAIQAYFSEGAGRSLRDKLSPKEWDDLTHFEGNANAFRLLTHRFNGRRKGGFAMTYSTLASIVKYPFESSLAGSHGKFGFFTSEKDDFIKVADELGMTRLHTGDGEIRYARHPLVYIVEAADDICYEIMDIEDAHKLKILSTDEVIPLLLGYFDDTRKARIEHVMSNVDDPNERIAYLRSCIIGILVEKCADAFAAHEQEILDGSFSGSLLDHITPLEKECYRKCEELSWNKIYCASDVVEIELAGTRIISFLIDELVNAVSDPTLNYSRLLLAKVPEQYEINSPTLYGKIQAILDHISGMTDVYALDLYRRLNGMSLKINN
ncbi:dGTP triphosphohydrolase [Duncaniella freteri]|jgi:dGTPase|uniref:dGTP triphosphohydrolase n=2 Tax=Duncaniella TaxID=2518495 RepID=UPI0013719B72|nr:dNTP triphosphohydrolase [Duncaniella freteri]NBJ06935.1 dNTP triphosphohydrolase [Alistipes sp. Z76]NCE69027.1 dNTP triphosphohydrolase [Muribaculaceae bacterium M3]